MADHAALIERLGAAIDAEIDKHDIGDRHEPPTEADMKWARERRAALDAAAQGGEPVRGVHGPVREGSLLCFCGREWPHGSKGSAR